MKWAFEACTFETKIKFSLAIKSIQYCDAFRLHFLFPVNLHSGSGCTNACSCGIQCIGYITNYLWRIFNNSAVDIFSMRSRTSCSISSLRRNIVCTYQYNLTNVSARACSDFNRENGTQCNEYIKAYKFSWKRLMQWHSKWAANHSNEIHPKQWACSRPCS